MRVLVTGGTGFLGRNLIRTLKSCGYDVVSLNRRKTDLTELEIIYDLSSLPEDALINLGFDCIIHCAARVGFTGSYKDFYLANVVGTKRLLMAAKKACIENFIYTSSPSVVFDGDHIFYGDENLPYARNPKSPYSQTKIIAERAVLSSGLKAVVLRPHLIFGPDDTNLLPSIISSLQRRKLFKFTNEDFLADFTFIDDCVDAHIKAIDFVFNKYNPKFNVFFISSGEPVFIWEFIQEIAKHHNLKLDTIVLPEVLIKAFAFINEIRLKIFSSSLLLTRALAEHLLRHHFFDISRAKEVLRYNPNGSVFEKLKFSLNKLCTL